MAGKNATNQRAAAMDRPFHPHGLRPLPLRPRMDRRLGGRCHGAGRRRAQGTRDGLSPRRAGRPVGRRLGIAGGPGTRCTGRRRDLDRRGPPRRGDQDARRHHAGPFGMAERDRGAQARTAGRAGELRRRCLRRRRPHGRRAIGFRQERPGLPSSSTIPRASRATARPATSSSPASSAAASRPSSTRAPSSRPARLLRHVRAAVDVQHLAR